MTTTTELKGLRRPYKTGCTEKENSMHIGTTSKITNPCRQQTETTIFKMTKHITINHYIVKSLFKFITQSVTLETEKRTVYDKALE